MEYLTIVKSGKFNSGGVLVTVNYKGQEYELKGVPCNDFYGMKMSKAFGFNVEVYLYDGALYYAPNAIYTWIDQVYYFCMVCTVSYVALLIAQVTEKYRI